MTIKDVAIEANVSVSTVSRVLNKNSKVDPLLKQKVEMAVKTLGYRPNQVAKSLAQNRTNTIGIIVNNLHDPFFGNLIKGFEEGAKNTGYNVVFASILGSSPSNKQQYLEYFSSGVVDGIILYGSRISDDDLLSHFTNRPTKYAIIENDLSYNDCFKFLIDNVDGTRKGVDYLYKKGFRNINYLGGNPSRKVMIDRLNGYLLGMKDKNLSLNDNSISYITDDNSCAYNVTKKMINNNELPQAIICGDDAIASYAISALTDSGISVPKDISVLGFDNRSILPNDYKGPRITSISQPLFEIGKDSVVNLSKYLKKEISDFETKIYKTNIIEKDTVLDECKL